MDIVTEKVQNKPPTWYLEKYQVADDGRVSKVRGMLVKGKNKHVWTLFVESEVFVCKSRRSALSFFEKGEFHVQEEDRRPNF